MLSTTFLANILAFISYALAAPIPAGTVFEMADDFKVITAYARSPPLDVDMTDLLFDGVNMPVSDSTTSLAVAAASPTLVKVVLASSETTSPTINNAHYGTQREASPTDFEVPVDFMPEPTLPAKAKAAHDSDKKATSQDHSTKATGAPLVMAYYPDWAGADFPPEKIDFARFDWIDFAFALPSADFTLSWDDTSGAPALLKRLVTAAHSAGSKVKLSVGGWTGSKYFSPAVSSEGNRKIFAGNILKAYQTFNLDGIDIDWEYPSQPGAPGNIVSPDDTNNYLAFLKLLRSTLPSNAKISAAVLTQPFADGSGRPMADVSAFAAVLDWVLIMNYDVWGSSATPGPNAPLSDACKNSTQPGASANAAVKQWTTAGFPAKQLVLGLPSYGYMSRSTAMFLRQRSVKLESEDGSGGDGQIQFRDLVDQGALKRAAPADDSSAPGAASKFVGGGGYERHWDACSSTPFLRSEIAHQVVTYDDPESIALKASFAKGAGILGVNMFDVHGDTDSWDLIDAARLGLGL